MDVCSFGAAQGYSEARLFGKRSFNFLLEQGAEG